MSSKFIKRFFDIIVSGLGLLFLAPIGLWIAWRVRKDAPGPIFYRGKRAGLNGKTFEIIKFRSMFEDLASYQGPPITAQDDPRITPFGRWLRDTKLNELPQLWNVFVGDMSLVGPRPEDPQIVAQWDESVRLEVLSVRPGITSPASVMYRDEEQLLTGHRWMDIYLGDILPSKLRLDQLYVRHRTLSLDLDVIFWTLMVLLPRVGSYSPQENRLFLGPASLFSSRYLSWFILDTIVSLVAIILTGLFWRSFGPLDVGWQTAAIFAVGFAILFSLSGAIFGINRVAWSQASGEDALILVPAILLAAVIGSTANLMIDNQYRGSPPLLPPLMILMAAFLASGGFLTVRFRYRILRGFERRWIGRWTKTSLGQERVLVVGGGESGQLAAALLSTSSYASHFKVIGFVDDDLYIQGIRFHGIEVLGRRQDLPQLVEKHDVGLLLFSIHNISARERRDLLNICDATQARTVLFPDMPGALNTLVSAKVKTISSNILPEAVNGKLPCHICLIKLSPMVIDGWLAGLQESAQAGDLESLNQELTRLRELLSADSLLQRQANQEFFAEKQVKFER